jgi:uncharacterized protein (TIGR02145 family)
MKHLFFALVLFIFCKTNAQEAFKDLRDNQVYKTVKVGNQVWMAENLKFVVKDMPYKMCYDYDAANCSTYGYMYDWESAKAACPKGWHLPTEAEWNEMIKFLGGDSIAGGKMKEAKTKNWTVPNKGATNSSGFNALPGGSCSAHLFLGESGCNSMGDNASFWTATEFNDGYAWDVELNSSDAAVKKLKAEKTNYLSIRCIKDK